MDFRLITDIILRVGSVLFLLIAIFVCIRLIGIINILKRISSSVLDKTQLLDHVLSLPLILITKRLDHQEK